jgi:hypothetical protein
MMTTLLSDRFLPAVARLWAEPQLCHWYNGENIIRKGFLWNHVYGFYHTIRDYHEVGSIALKARDNLVHCRLASVAMISLASDLRLDRAPNREDRRGSGNAA